MPARLTFCFSDRPQHVVELNDDDGADDVLLGREPQCSIVLEDDRLSRRHARLHKQNAGWLLQDLDSKNGTLVDGRRVDSILLAQPAWISFGGCLARFEPLSKQALAVSARERFQRWQTSAQLQRDLDPDLGLEELLRRLLRGAQRVSGTDRAFVLLQPLGGELTVVATRGLTLLDVRDPEFTGSVGAVDLALQERRTVVHSDFSVDPRVGGRASVLAGGIRTLVCLPLLDGDRCLGALYADSQQPGRGIDELDVQILEALAHHAGLALAVMRLTDETLALSTSARKLDAAPELESPDGLGWGELQAVHDLRGELAR